MSLNPDDFPRFACDARLMEDWHPWIERMKKAFPDVDIEQDMRTAHVWLTEGKGRKKPYKAMIRFLTKWFQRSQERLGARRRRIEEADERRIAVTREKINRAVEDRHTVRSLREYIEQSSKDPQERAKLERLRLLVDGKVMISPEADRGPGLAEEVHGLE